MLLAEAAVFGRSAMGEHSFGLLVRAHGTVLMRRPGRYLSTLVRVLRGSHERWRDRLRTLEQHILNLRFLRAAFLTRFPSFNTKPLVREPVAPTAPAGNGGLG